MNEDLKKKWVAALRSRRYKQGRKFLRSKSNEFCCLGVLADVCGTGWTFSENFDSYKTCDGDIFLFNNNVLNKIGLTDKNQVQLAGMNDGNYSFAQIADFIEKELT